MLELTPHIYTPLGRLSGFSKLFALNRSALARVLQDLRWCIRHHSSVEKSAGLEKFGLSAGPRFDSGRNPVNSNQCGFEQIDPQARVLNYSQSHLRWHFRKLKSQSSNVSFDTFQWKETFELWALSFETAFQNVTPSGIGCTISSNKPQ